MEQIKKALLSAEHAAKMLGVDRRQLKKMADAGTLKRTKLYPGANWRYYREEVEAIARGEHDGV